MSQSAPAKGPYDLTAVNPMKSGNIQHAVLREAHQAAPASWLRELAVNGFEAGATDVWFTVTGWANDFFGEGKVSKVCCIDNGCGMTADDVRRFINRYSSSGKRQGLRGNFGTGAKVSTLVEHPAGVAYLTWKDGQGSMAILKVVNGEVGLAVLDSDGNDVIAAPEGSKPDQLGDGDGTMVVLLGQRRNSDTTRAPKGCAFDSKDWMSKVLAQRFFDLPGRLHVSEPDNRSDTGYRNRQITAGRVFHDTTCESQGSVSLTEATAHWYIQPATAPKAHGNVNGAKFGVLMDGEVYHDVYGVHASPVLAQFGVSIGAQRVAVFVEPHDSLGVLSNGVRSRLGGRKPLPMEQWAREFRSQLPDDLRELQAAMAEQQSAGKRGLKALQRIWGDFGLRRYRAVRNGADAVTLDASVGGEHPIDERPEHPTPAVPGTGHADPPDEDLVNQEDPAGEQDASGNGGGSGGNQAGGRDSDDRRVPTDDVDQPDGSVNEGGKLTASRDGELRGEQEPGFDAPRPVWVSADPDSGLPARDQQADGQYDLEDVLCRYTPATNELKFNFDFRLVGQLVDEYVEIAERHTDGMGEVHRPRIAGLVREAIYVRAAGPIMAARNLVATSPRRGRRVWRDADMDMLDEKALTIATLASIDALRSSLNNALGKDALKGAIANH